MTYSKSCPLPDESGVGDIREAAVTVEREGAVFGRRGRLGREPPAQLVVGDDAGRREPQHRRRLRRRCTRRRSPPGLQTSNTVMVTCAVANPGVPKGSTALAVTHIFEATRHRRSPGAGRVREVAGRRIHHDRTVGWCARSVARGETTGLRIGPPRQTAENSGDVFVRDSESPMAVITHAIPAPAGACALVTAAPPTATPPARTRSAARQAVRRIMARPSQWFASGVQLQGAAAGGIGRLRHRSLLCDNDRDGRRPAGCTSHAPPPTVRWTAQWKELYDEVITTGLCTGCAGCVVTCPHDVIGYEHEEGKYIPFHLEEELGLDNCIHGREGGCTTCTRACPRFRAWEPAADMHLFGRVREPDEMSGIWRQLLLTRATDDEQHEKGQDGGFVSAMLMWLMRARLHRGGDGLGRRGRRRVEGQAGARPQPRGGARHRRQPLHVLRQPAGAARRRRRRASTGSRSSAWAARRRRRR